MASKRLFKKQIIAASLRIFEDALITRSFATEDQRADFDNLIDELIVWTDDTLRRIARPDGKDNPKLVKSYYKQLRQDAENKTEQLYEQLTELVERL